MLLAPRHQSTFADLLRLISGWMAAVLLVQGFAAVQLQAAGPLHRHRANAGVATAAATTLALWQHSHHHGTDQRHHHDGSQAAQTGLVQAADANLVDDALAAAAAALVAAFAVLATGQALRAWGRGGRVWCASAVWAWLTALPEALLKPPQPA